MLKNEEAKKLEELIDGAKRGDKVNIEIIIKNFYGLIKSTYNNDIYDESRMEWEDYEQECKIKIIKCINEVSKKNYWQLFNLVEVSIRNITVDLGKKQRRFNDTNIPCGDRIDIYNLEKSCDNCQFEEQLVSDIVVSELYKTFIKDKLTKEENRVFCYFISGKRLKDYSERKGVQLESVKRTLRRAINKIKNIKELREIYCMGLAM
ncbi:helix-turn-helix domain-containing protein [Clostridiaceae bacterium UIB06]|uniref:Helix-turn-helix domain-containing protein n=1 Tax=Clostridium thailandense TaxID=2794346 RepID=A0A949TR31_9CLOT|nr:helix-turn-helix domain-containing protein [Clostridium thailandense]MBV7273837.1 helix-turn-helix domain-containing protein [Clostridium thailandense]MCH5136898.1 helix-turn-helix domain-containing protein [Clostridiaceae bacterium UIB06]